MNENDGTIKNSRICGEIQKPVLNKHFAVINPSKMCQPMGAVQALLGVRGVMPLIHGSQGCSTYMRFQLCRHFREPVNVSSTSMSEGTVVYGGEANLLKALETIWKEYKPEIIGVTSSCLTETVGDDMSLIIRKFHEKHPDEELPAIVPISTPSYAGSHVDGYDKAIKSLIENLACPGEPNGKINFITGNISPADIREVKEILEILDIESIILTDSSESLDSPHTDSVSFLPSEGTTVDEIRDAANSKATVSLSRHADSGAKFLEKRFDVKSISGFLPVGLQSMDSFISSICKLNGCEVPVKLEKERGRLIDAMVDAHPYNYGRKIAVYGDPDVVVALARFTAELGMIPSIVCTGPKSKRFLDDMKIVAEESCSSPAALEGCDFYDLHQQIKENPVDLLIGNSYGARIAKEENIPHLRIGFPIYDRLGAQRTPMVGYKAGISLVDTLANIILENYYDESGHEIK
ncbi:MAG: nitrogenase iron-molybdenum cofactor biosynthesis protein NifN [Methanobacteriaceae archaeon]|jgi:nitrogenase molybdenum-iron protein beta chain